MDSTDEAGAVAAHRELTRRALAGDDAAWGELVRRHSPRVRVVLIAMGVTLEAVDDLVQDSWVRLLEQHRTGRLASLELPGLAVAQARWLALAAFRTQKRRADLAERAGSWPHGDDAPEVAPADVEVEARRRARTRCIQTELSRCHPRARAVFEAVYGPRALSHAEAAEAMGLSVQRTRQILCEVRARLRRSLEAASPDGETR